MPLPEPTTRSPGSLKLVYNNGSEVHTLGARLKVGVSITDTGALLAVAMAFANAAKEAMFSGTVITSWRICDPAGLTLYEATFGSPIPGSRDPSEATYSSASTSHTLVGKATPVVVGERAGSTRTVVYPGGWNAGTDGARRRTLVEIPSMVALWTFLNASSAVGADFYGQDVDYKPFVDIQLNAHWQQKLGF